MAIATGVYVPGETTLTPTQMPTTNWGQVGLGLSIASGITSAIGARVSKYSYEIQAMQMRVKGRQATAEAKYTNLKLLQNYNDIQAANMVMGALSGRSVSSESVLNISRADQEKLNWDMEYSTLSGQIGKIGAEAEAIGYKAAGRQAQITGITKGLLGAMGTYAKFKQIG